MRSKSSCLTVNVLAIFVAVDSLIGSSFCSGQHVCASEPAVPPFALPASTTSATDFPVAAKWEELIAARRWIFLGDSNTYSGGYVALLDAWLNGLTDPPQLLNLGMSSETAAGTSEVDHPFKRPCVHERIEKVLRITQPDVVFVGYGMNDGIYQPYSAQNLAKYQLGMLKLASIVKASGAKLIVLTPPIFEPEPLAALDKLGPTANGRYAYFAPAADYDNVLAKQAEWCLSNVMKADLVIDIRTPLIREKQRQAELQHYTNDGVHFGAVAHGIVAEAILDSLDAPASFVARYPTEDLLKLARRKMVILRNAFLSATGKNRPGLPAGDPVWLAESLADTISAKMSQN
jgi:lysophospholipase L1-like esterase